MVQVDNMLSSDSVAPSVGLYDSLSINSRQTTATLPNNFNESQARSKYNTLTPAEAKKLNRFLNNGKQPIRTASVLHRPRPPPIMVTDLDNGRDCLDSASVEVATTYVTSIGNSSNNQQQQLQFRNNSTSLYGSLKDRRHSINYGRSNTLSCSRAYVTPNNNSSKFSMSQHQHQQGSSLHDSESNLSYRSSIETPDGIYGSKRMKTISVDLGNPAKVTQIYESLRGRKGSIRSTRTTGASEYQSNKLSDDSFTSARSEISMDFDKTPTKSNQHTSSKVSLSSSTYKVLQSPFTNFKRLFRNMPRPFANSQDERQQQFDANSIGSQHKANKGVSNQCQQSLEQSISNLCLNRSQSPPVCPPPPGELKSMTYMQDSVNYSNYDEFTRSRNERINGLANGGQQRVNMMNSVQNTSHNYQPPVDVFDGLSSKSRNLDNDDSDSWQLTSLPVSYERNLATVVEERQNLSDIQNLSPAIQTMSTATPTPCEYINLNVHSSNNLIRPPVKFDDNERQHPQTNKTNGLACQQNQAPLNSDSTSSQSLASTATTDSVLDQHRKAAATAYRFSFAQPVPSLEQANYQRDIGLPPRMPANATNDSKQLDTSSGNSSNCSSQLNGINNCDRQPISLNIAEHLDKNSFSSDGDSTGGVGGSGSGCYGNVNVNGIDTDADTTILSETSTIQGDSSAMMYANKLAELERTVTSLKNKLITKEKELTDLQLSQLHNDYTIDKLKSQVNKLERENAYLKSTVIKNNSNNSQQSQLLLSGRVNS